MRASPILLTLFALGSSACQMLMPPGGMVGGGTPAENPLVSGGSLEARSKGDVGVVSADDCDKWPFEDTLTVRATEAEICANLQKHMEQPPGWKGEPTANRSEGLRVSTDGPKSGYINADKVRASKVGSCFNKGYNEQVQIWMFEYQGCTPNDGMLTKASKTLSVGDESWTFSPPPGEAASPPAAGADSPPAPEADSPPAAEADSPPGEAEDESAE